MELSIDSFKYPITEYKLLDVYGSCITVYDTPLIYSYREFASYVHDVKNTFDDFPIETEYQWLFVRDTLSNEYYCNASNTGVNVYDVMPQSLLMLLLTVE